MRLITDATLKKFRNKICLLRIDLNADDFRLKAALPTVKLLRKHKIKIIILSHRGRPTEKNKKPTLKPFCRIIAKKIGEPVVFLANLPKRTVIEKSSKNGVFLLENLRFWLGEAKNDPKFAQKLAILGDFYINEAFSVSHRQNASISAITRFLPSYAGLRFGLEIKRLSEVMSSPQHPFTIILGGAKISEKIRVVGRFLKRADYFLLGSSINFKSSSAKLKPFLKLSKIKLPVDFKMSDGKPLDIGTKTISEYRRNIEKSKTIIWNGPMGMFEKKGFERGTKEIWRAILSNKKAKIVVGGGETIASLSLIRNSKFSIPRNLFFSTGGGAMLEFLSGKKLPGVTALEKNGK